MKDSFFRSMSWLHTWVGLLVCWLLLLIFFAGTTSFFRHEISFWAQPAVHDLPDYNPALQRQIVSDSIAKLQQQAADARSWRIEMPTERRPSLLLITSQQPEAGERRGKREFNYYNPLTLEPLPDYRETRGGNFFYRLHFDLHYMDAISARWIVCFASLFMLIALVSGVVIHKRIFKDLFQFRSGKGLRSWLDGHNVSSVIALPFHIMITYTGLVTLIFMLLPQPQKQHFGDRQAVRAEQFPFSASIEKSGQPLQQIALGTILDHYFTNNNDLPIRRISISSPADANATIKIYANAVRQVQDDPPGWMYQAASGELLATQHTELSAAEKLYGGMIALHTGRFAEPMLRWLYFLCGLAGCAMIATGAVMWAKRLRQKSKATGKGPFGLRLVEALNLATIMGLPAATAAFFHANRLLPIDLIGRADKEVLAFFITWGAFTLAAFVSASRRSWWFAALSNALLWGTLPLVNMLVTSDNTLIYLYQQQWLLFAVDAIAIITAIGFLIQANKLKLTASSSAAKGKRIKREVVDS
ncbi:MULTISPECIES: PepSY-associated TM helix domain-containing protein [unclassified Pseudoalteromonas]|uniref:PepSY-associated TM helix domain-containing protein n=1 Tax=unclassified Pseudoalteromonas TaxID=194690 RepID=UPI003014257D